MKKILILFMILCLLTGCNEKQNTNNETKNEEKEITLEEAQAIVENQIGEVVFDHEDEKLYYFIRAGAANDTSNMVDSIQYITINKKTKESMTISQSTTNDNANGFIPNTSE